MAFCYAAFEQTNDLKVHEKLERSLVSFASNARERGVPLGLFEVFEYNDGKRDSVASNIAEVITWGTSFLSRLLLGLLRRAKKYARALALFTEILGLNPPVEILDGLLFSIRNRLASGKTIDLGGDNLTTEQLHARLAIDDAARETTGRTSAEPRPDWIEARKSGEALPDFMVRAFKQELASGEMHRGLLSTYTDLQGDYYSLRRSKQFPEHLKNLPTRTVWIKQQVAEGKVNPVRPSSMQEDETRVYHRDMSRLSRARRRADADM